MSNPGEMLSAWLASGGAAVNTGRSQTSPAAEGDPTHADVSELGRGAILAMFFDVASWRGLPNHVCIVCGAGFLDPARAVDHALANHGPLVDPGRKRDTVESNEEAAVGPAEAVDLEINWPDNEGIER